MSRRRLALAACVIVAIVIVAIRYTQNRLALQIEQRRANLLASFERSFNSGATELVSEPRIENIERFWMPESGPGSFLAPEVNENPAGEFLRD